MKRMKKGLISLAFCAFIFMFTAIPSMAQEDTVGSGTLDYCLYLGQTLQLSDLPEEPLVISDEKIITVSKSGMVTAVGVGKATISIKKIVEKKEETEVIYTIEVKANELLENLSFNENSYPAKAVGSGSFAIDERAFDGLTCRWSSENSQIASVDEKGNVTPIASGKTNILVTVTDTYGGVYHFSIPVKIINPHFSLNKTNLAVGKSLILYILDTTGSVPAIMTSDSSVVSVSATTAQVITFRANKVGMATLTATVDGVSITCVVTVTNPVLKSQYGFYQKSKKLSVVVRGINSVSSCVWKSNNVSVATVTQTGKVKTKKYGSAVISCSVDGKTLSFYLAVSTKKAVKAMKYGYKRIGKARYSQVKRMSNGYFDCSSFVYRCYRSTGKYLVCKTSWAPVAADIARYYVKHKKYIKASKTYNLNKLRPGDLICFGGKKAEKNGRYKRIYHIAMYIGNGKTMESSSAYNNVVIRDRGSFKKSSVPVIARP